MRFHLSFPTRPEKLASPDSWCHARRAFDLDLATFAPDATAGEWADNCDALENAPLIDELDLVRPERTTNERLKERIQREGIAIYPEGTAA